MKQPKKEAKKKFSLKDFNEINSSNVKKKSIQQERKVVKKINATLTAQSGAKLFDPADIRMVDSIVEVKSALKSKQIIITESMLGKLLSESARVGKNPVLMLNFPNSELRNKMWAMMPFGSK